MIPHLTYLDSCFLFHFTPNCFFDGLTLVHEPGQRRVCPRPRQPASTLSEQAALAIGHDHDRHRISARKMVGLAGHAFAYLTAAALLGALATHAAELMASVPVELGPTLGQNTSLSRAESGCRGAGIFKPPCLIQIQLVARVAELRHVDGKVRNVVLQTEKHRWYSNVEAGHIGRTDPPRPCLLRPPEKELWQPGWWEHTAVA